MNVVNSFGEGARNGHREVNGKLLSLFSNLHLQFFSSKISPLFRCKL
jgi:hypothetical protein